jgi:hypothetical protein
MSNLREPSCVAVYRKGLELIGEDDEFYVAYVRICHRNMEQTANLPWFGSLTAHVPTRVYNPYGEDGQLYEWRGNIRFPLYPKP